IAQRYPKMSADEQAKIQEQMRPWAQLSPAERQAARQQFKSINQLPPEKKSEVKQKWEEYQSLPAEKRRELASTPAPAAGNKIPAPAAPPPPGTKPAASPSR
ncbi:MAG: DUF3106 domain-containing protein, partial [Burkholderiales bacterium]